MLFCLALLSCKKGKTTVTATDSISSSPIDTIRKNIDSSAVFVEMIPVYVERQYAKKFDQVASKHPNLLKSFTLDYPAFKELLENHSQNKNAKFYFIQDSANSKMNLGLAFSNNDDYTDISSDDKFVLVNHRFQSDQELQKKIKQYQSSLATQTGFNNKKATECILYTVSEIENYFAKVEKKQISRLDLAMIYFCPANDEDGSIYDRYNDKHDRISFAVHAIYTDGSTAAGYDAGDLKP